MKAVDLAARRSPTSDRMCHEENTHEHEELHDFLVSRSVYSVEEFTNMMEDQNRKQNLR